jgi:hypothetical protein
MKILLSITSFVGLIFLLSFVSANVIINEIMYDLNDSDTNREWVELYNNDSSSINISGWKFYEASTKHTLTLIGGSFNLEPWSYALIIQDIDVFIIDNPNATGNIFDATFSLSNSGEELSLWNGTNYISNLTYNTTYGANGDGKSLQFYNNSWCACAPTPGKENNCTLTYYIKNIPEINITNPQNGSVYNYTNITLNVSSNQEIINWSYSLNNGGNISFNNSQLNTLNLSNGSYMLIVYGTTENGTGNRTIYFTINVSLQNNSAINTTYTNNTGTGTGSSSDDIKLSLEWDEYDIVNGKEFEIIVNVENLENKYYDIKLSIENDSKVLSEIYDSEETDKWKSSNYYLKKAISREDSVKIKLRIKDNYRSFSGDAKIIAKIRQNGKNSILDEIEEDIEIIEKEETTANNPTTRVNTPSQTSNSRINSPGITGSAISLGSPNNKTKENANSIIYKSKKEYIKEYAPYLFGIVCVFIITTLLLDKGKR